MEKEIWKDVIGYEGIYEISSIGRVKRYDTGILLKPCSVNGRWH